MPRAIGVDIGADTLKICEVDGSARKFKIVRYLEAKFESGGTLEQESEEISEALRSVFQENKLRRDQVVATLPTRDCLLRDISVPFTANEQIQKVIRFEAENHLHSCALEDVVVEFHKTGESGNRSQVLIFAGIKKHLKRTLDIFENAGVDPLQVDLESVAVYNVVSAIGLLEPGKLSVILDIGARSTNLLIADGEELELVRSIRGGIESTHTPTADSPVGEQAGNQGDWVVVEDAVATPEDVASAEQTPDAEASVPPAPSITPIEYRELPFLAKIVVELNRSLARSRSPKKLGKILITGGGSQVEGLPAALEDSFQVPVEWVDLKDRVESSITPEEMERVSAFGAVALGLAVKQIGHDPIGLDFRQEEFRYQKAFDQIKIALSCCISLIAILFLVILAFFLERKREASVPWQVLVNRSRELAELVIEDQPKSYDFRAVAQLVGRVERKNKSYRKTFGGEGEFPQIRSMFDIWNDVFRVIRREENTLEGLKIDSAKFQAANITLTGSAPNAVRLEQLENALKKSSDLFQDVDTGKVATDSKNQRVTFSSFKINLPEEE